MKQQRFGILLIEKLLFLTFAFSGFSAYAQTAEKETLEQGEPLQPSSREVGTMLSGYNSPARIDVHGPLDFSLTGSFLYWQSKLEGLDLGNYSYTTPPQADGHVLEGNFDFNPGFKVAFALHSTFDNWSLYGEFTWVRANNKTHYTLPSNVNPIAIWNSSSPLAFHHVHSRWIHQNNIVDIDLGRAYYVGKNLTFFPFIGTRGYWIDQKFGVKYFVSSTSSAASFSSQDSWAAGARLGVQTFWLLGKGLRVEGNAAGSLVYQKFHTKFRDWDIATQILDRLKRSSSQITPNLEGALGMGWGSYFSRKEWHLDLLALCEFHCFWKQNSMRSLLDQFITRAAGPIDLTYQGLTLTIRLDF